MDSSWVQFVIGPAVATFLGLIVARFGKQLDDKRSKVIDKINIERDEISQERKYAELIREKELALDKILKQMMIMILNINVIYLKKTDPTEYKHYLTETNKLIEQYNTVMKEISSAKEMYALIEATINEVQQEMLNPND